MPKVLWIRTSTIDTVQFGIEVICVVTSIPCNVPFTCTRANTGPKASTLEVTSIQRVILTVEEDGLT